MFDTSGVVHLREKVPVGVIGLACFAWEDLSPFAQGYVEALFAQLEEDRWCDNAGREPELKPTLGFSDLAPEALAVILRDCERMDTAAFNSLAGNAFWRERQGGFYRDHFPPLRIYLNDAGKVLAEVL